MWEPVFLWGQVISDNQSVLLPTNNFDFGENTVADLFSGFFSCVCLRFYRRELVAVDGSSCTATMLLPVESTMENGKA